MPGFGWKGWGAAETGGLSRLSRCLSRHLRLGLDWNILTAASGLDKAGAGWGPLGGGTLTGGPWLPLVLALLMGTKP